MSFINKFFNKKKKNEAPEEVNKIPENLNIEENFIHHFLDKGGKFIYNTTLEEVAKNFKLIIEENNWEEIATTNQKVAKIINNGAIKVVKKTPEEQPFLTNCEFLISDDGSILFTSNQLKSTKLFDASKNFIVFATTSQFVKSTNEALTTIKMKFKKELPSNISSVKNYKQINTDDNFLNHSSSKSKNLYLLLFEDL